MWFWLFCFFKILWILFQNKNYVVQSAEKQLNRSPERSHKRLRIALEYESYSDACEYVSCGSSVENVSSSLTVPDVAPAPDDAPSTSSNTKHLRTTSSKKMLNESQSKPSLLSSVDMFYEAQKALALNNFNESDDKTVKLLDDISKIESGMSQTIDNAAMTKPPEGWGAIKNSDKSDDETDEDLLDELISSITCNSQTMDNTTIMKYPEGWNALRDSDMPDEETVNGWLDNILVLFGPNSPTMDTAAMMKSLENWDELMDSDKSDDEIDKKLLDDILKSIDADSRTMDTSVPAKQPECSDNEKNLDALSEDDEYVLPGATLSPLKHSDTSTLNKNVSDALDILPEVEKSSKNRLENISYGQFEYSMKEMPSVSGIHLSNVGLQHDTNVDNVTTANAGSRDVLKKGERKKKNDGDKEASTSSQAVSKWEIPSNMKSIDMKLMQNMTKKLIKDLELHTCIDENELYACLKQAEESISCKSGCIIDIENTNKGTSTILPLFLHILSSKVELKFSNDLKSVSDIFNSFAIFHSCFACLLATYHTFFSQQLHLFKRRRSEKRSMVLDVVEMFLKIDERKNCVRLQSLFSFNNTEKKSHRTYFYNYVIKSALCLLGNKSSLFNMRQKLKEYHNRLELLCALPTEVSEICEDKKKDVDAKAQALKKLLESYVNEIKLFMSALKDEQQELITKISHKFSNVKEMIIFIFYSLGKNLTLLLSWNCELKSNFLFLMTIFNQLLITCKNYVQCETSFNEEISSLLTEKEFLSEALFGNMFFLIYKALIFQLKLLAEKTLKEIDEETNKSDKLNVNKILEMIKHFCSEVNNLKKSMFSGLVDIIERKEKLEQQEHITSELHKIDDNVKMLINKIYDKKSTIRKKKLKEEASTFEKIINDFNSVFTKAGMEPLEQKKLKQLKEYVQCLQSTSSLSESDN